MSAQPISASSMLLAVFVCIILAVLGTLFILFPKQLNRFFIEGNILAPLIPESEKVAWWNIWAIRMVGMGLLFFMGLLIGTVILHK